MEGIVEENKEQMMEVKERMQGKLQEIKSWKMWINVCWKNSKSLVAVQTRSKQMNSLTANPATIP